MSVASRSIGPYRIVRALGKGGMGVVYEAEDAGGARVALKTLHLPSMEMAGTIRREIQSLARLSHPGIVRIVDHGDHEGLPWYAMELFRGATLREYMRGARATLSTSPRSGGDATQGQVTRIAASPTVPDAMLDAETARYGRGAGSEPPHLDPAAAGRERPIGEILTIVARLCAPLAYLHGAGIVHRDLKPENVVLKDGAAPVLVDFGLASPWSGDVARDTLDTTGGVAGTASYMSPEQWRGEIVDARTDLYALGCILHELLTGAPPFVAASAPEMLALHLHAPPAPASRVASGVVPELDALVLGLLAKDARERIGYAEDVAATLATLGASVSPDGAARPYLYRPALAGREMELRQLQAALDDVRADAGAARGILLSGESGVGKTRLLGELARIARIREMTVVTAGCAPGTRAPLAAFRPMLRALADRCREHGSAAAALAKEAPVLAPYEPDLARLAGTAQPAPADLPPAEAAARLFRALTAALSTLAGDSSVLVIVDDLQWADDLSIGFCEHLVTGDSPGAARVLLVCGYRREEITDPVARLAERNVTRMTLERIDLEGVASMVRDALALQRTPDAFARFLTQHSEGNPFFVAEYLKTAVSEGLLTRDARGTWRIADAAAALVDDDASRLPLPPPVRDLVTRRLAMVGDRSRALLELAAATGRESNRTFLAAAMVLSGASMSIDALSVACERGLIEEAPDGAIRFTHDKIREVVLADAPRDRMRGLHATIARTGETLYRDRDDWVAELARQWDEAGEPAKAAPCYQRAATIAAARHALADAERLLRACLRVTEEKSAAGIVARFDLASRVLDQAGRMSEAEEVILTAVGGARAIGNRRLEADGLRQHAVVCYRTGRMEEARERAIQSLAICRELADRRREGQALGLLGSIALDVGGATEAWERYETALAIHREVGDEPSAGSVLSSMALMAQRWGHAERATGLYEEALASAQKTGARWSEGISRGNLALLHQAAGRMADARDELERALAIHREVGNRRFEGATLGNLGKLHLDQGRLADAARLLDEATHIHEQVNNRTHGAVTLANVALLFRAQGRLEESRDACARAVAIFGELGDVQRKGNRLADLGKVLQELGQLVEARAAYTESLEIARRVDNRQREGIVLRDLAGLERLADADPATIAKLLDDAEAILVSAGEDAELLELACERGHAAIASGRSATSHLAEAEKRIAALGAGPESLRGIAVARLHRAQSAHDAALLLRHGMALQDLPSGS